MQAQGPALIWCPFPDAATAAATAGTLLDERLVACANIVPTMLSLFEWDGERGEASEAGALFKTDAALLDRAIARLAEEHPYDEPAILRWRCDGASPGTTAWLGALTR
ncbi:MAG: divalent-cation tolerance protein CutA [Novosphingobium sp.]